MEQDFTPPGAYNLLGSGSGSLGDETNKSISPLGEGKELCPALCPARKSQGRGGFGGVFLGGSRTGSSAPAGVIRHGVIRDPQPAAGMAEPRLGGGDK